MSYAIPLYQRIYEDVKAAIEGGAYAEGDQFPTEQQVMGEYGVSRVTVRRAIGQLCDEGYLARVQGSGTFVRNPKRTGAFRQTGGLQSFSDVCVRRGLEPGARLISCDKVRVRPEERTFFGLGREDSLIYLRRVLSAGGEALVDENVYLPMEGFEYMLVQSLDDSSLFAALRDLSGRSPTTVHRRTIEAVRANEAQAMLLKVEAGSPLLQVTTFCLDELDRPLCVIRSACVGDRYVLAF